MATLEADTEGFCPVMNPKTSKKAKTTPTGAPQKTRTWNGHLHDFYASTETMQRFQPIAAHEMVDCWDVEVWSDDCHSCTYQCWYSCPSVQQISDNETKSKQYFSVHPIPKCPIHCNKVTIGCRILSTKTITNIKTEVTDTTLMMAWLKMHQIYLEINSLGCKTSTTLDIYFSAPQHDTAHLPQRHHPRSYHGCCYN